MYLFLDRGEGKEKERVRNTNVWLPPVYPPLGPWLTTQACAWTGNRIGDPQVHRPAFNPLSHTSQDSGVASFVESIGFSMCTIMSSANNDSFTPFFPVWMLFSSFSCLIIGARTLNTKSNKSGERGHSCLLPNLEGILFSFCPMIMVLLRLLVYGLYYVDVCFLYSHFADCFYHKWVLYLLKCSFCIY